jgi:DNA polymerase
MKIVVADSSNIEARQLDWLACQDNMLDVYRAADAGTGPDVYCVTASGFYNREITPADTQERQLGKTIKLACGYQMGGERFQETTRILSGGKLVIDIGTARAGVGFYRASHPMIVQLWDRAQSALAGLANGIPEGEEKYLDPRGVLKLEKNAILLPNGLRIRYPQLSFDADQGWSFGGTRGRSHLYGGKVVEHVTQALAKIVVMDQLLTISRKFKIVMTSHDEGAFCVRDDAAEECLEYALEVMSKSPKWAPDMPVKAKGNIAVRYGDAK